MQRTVKYSEYIVLTPRHCSTFSSTVGTPPTHTRTCILHVHTDDERERDNLLYYT